VTKGEAQSDHTRETPALNWLPKSTLAIASFGQKWLLPLPQGAPGCAPAKASAGGSSGPQLLMHLALAGWLLFGLWVWQALGLGLLPPPCALLGSRHQGPGQACHQGPGQAGLTQAYL